MVISVFPDVSQGFARYEASRANRLSAQAQRMQMEMAQREEEQQARQQAEQQARYAALLSTVEDPVMAQAMVNMEPGEGAEFFARTRNDQVTEARARQDDFLNGAAERFSVWSLQNPDEDPNVFWDRQYNLAGATGVPVHNRQAFMEAGMARAMGEGDGPVDPDIERYLAPAVGNNPPAIVQARVGPDGTTRYFNMDNTPYAGDPNALQPYSTAMNRLEAAQADSLRAAELSSNPDAEDARAEAIAIAQFGGDLQDYRQTVLGAGPDGFGLAGFTNRFAQTVSQQLLQARGISFSDVRARALNAAQNPEGGGEPNQELIDTINSMFDEDLAALGPTALLLAYSAASTLADQSGRSLSDKDLQNFIRIIGNPEGLFSSYAGTLATIERLDDKLMRDINVERTYGANPRPALPEELSFLDGSVTRWVSAETQEDRDRIVQTARMARDFRREEIQEAGGQILPPRREDFASRAEYRAAYQEYADAQGWGQE